jgi:hypothetical protein
MPRNASLTREIRAISTGFKQLAVSFARLAPILAAVSADGVAPRKATRRRMTITPARRAQLKLQGQYLGYMRGLKPRQKAKVRAIREKKGVRAAIAAAKRMSR